ncbi:glycosyltransferase family 2 protein [Planomonospora sp. ID67723]|uniref:glycosyltransferase family 2 protein n=1 Tax=Planomonospora sp. ID67723 TaxID=2738134 RepID=UPI0018C37279|nr:glycosyltransferase family 2 protein [Planomonospora sp. ID67723]MBG0827433.1 glycosyltransferase family 2 protein [Planomonospora sp. ID67723]
MKLSVIVVTYRSGGYIGRCLAALESATKGLDAEVVVVDNNSGDGTVDAVRETAPWAKVVARERNGGFAEGCVAGAEAARGRYLVFVNPDAEVQAGALSELIACAERHPDAGIVGGRCVTDAGESDPRSWWGRPTLWSLFCFGTGLSTVFPGHPRLDPESPRPWSGDPDETRRVPIVTGALMLVERALWDRVGGFDTRIFMYGEDADLCLRAAAAGFRPMVTARAVFLHPGGMSSTSLRKMMLLYTGKATVVRRHFPPATRGLGLALLQAGVWLRATASRGVAPPSAERQGRPTTSRSDWLPLWKARAEWRGGWDDRR